MTRREPAQARSRATRDAVLDAASRLAELDPALLQAATIAGEAGIGTGTLYQYFTGVDDVIDAADPAAPTWIYPQHAMHAALRERWLARTAARQREANAGKLAVRGATSALTSARPRAPFDGAKQQTQPCRSCSLFMGTNVESFDSLSFH